MGEIGFPRKEFLHELKWWEVKSIIRGYNRRHRHLWSATRWQTYQLMCAFAGGDKLSEQGIHRAADLIKFPWDQDIKPITKAEAAELQAEIDAINAAAACDNGGDDLEG